MNSEDVSNLKEFDAPYGRQIVLQNVAHESGMQMLRVRIREGSRFTILDLDAETAGVWGAEMVKWADEQRSSPE